MGTQFVSSGAVSSGIVVTSGNTLVVLSGGTASTTTVNGGTVAELLSGRGVGTQLIGGGVDLVSGTASGAIVNNGTQYALSAGLASETVLSGATAGQVVFSSGLAQRTSPMVACSDQRRPRCQRRRRVRISERCLWRHRRDLQRPRHCHHRRVLGRRDQQRDHQ